jgi:hypothetical protein
MNERCKKINDLVCSNVHPIGDFLPDKYRLGSTQLMQIVWLPAAGAGQVILRLLQYIMGLVVLLLFVNAL